MKRGQLVALIAGATVGIAGVTLGVILARKEGRDAARRFLDESQVGQKSVQAAQQIATSARKVGEQVARTATEQYQTQLPRAREAINSVIQQAPQAAEALSAVMPRRALNGKVTDGGANA
ncbi:MAG TPA: hypothetical protein VGP82_05070 [Ktedonobacterales bacterium]|nr:hypothetical protein [Ktedonobacterales bacterium]